MTISFELGRKFNGDYLPTIEGPVLSFSPSGPLLDIQLKNLSEQEVSTFKTSLDFHFALFVSENILYFLTEIPKVIDWSDAPYFLGTVSTDLQPQFPPEEETILLKLTVVLIEGTNQEVRAIREFSLPEEFSEVLVESIEQQRSLQLDAGEAVRRITRIQRKTKPTQMLNQAQARFPLTHSL